jgi:hypothetical protein
MGDYPWFACVLLAAFFILARYEKLYLCHLCADASRCVCILGAVTALNELLWISCLIYVAYDHGVFTAFLFFIAMIVAYVAFYVRFERRDWEKTLARIGLVAGYPLVIAAFMQV